MGIEWDGLSLAEFTAAAKEITQETADALADDAGARLTELVRRNTPMDEQTVALREAGGYREVHAPGMLRESVKQSQLTVHDAGDGVDVYRTGAETDLHWAAFVEFGTGLWGREHRSYVIRPKRPGGWLSWIATASFTREDGSVVAAGTRVFAREVHVRGQRGAAMFAKGAALLESEFTALAEEHLTDWRRDIERLA